MDWSLNKGTMCRYHVDMISVKPTSLTDEQEKGLGGKVNEDRNNENIGCGGKVPGQLYRGKRTCILI